MTRLRSRPYNRCSLLPPSAGRASIPIVPVLLLPTLLLAPAAPTASSVPAGDEPLPDMTARIPRAELVLAESGCTFCHGADEDVLRRLDPRRAPSLLGLGERATAAWIEEFLARPGTHGPGPDLTSRLPADERAALAQFLRLPTEPAIPAPPPTHTPAELESGRALFHTIGCVACHEPFEEAWERELPYWFGDEQLAADEARVEDGLGAPAEPEERYVPPGTFAPVSVPLADLARRHTVESLAEYLSDPLPRDPDGRMPDFDLTSREARDLAVYLLRDQALGGARVFSGEPGLQFERFDDVHAARLPDFDTLEPAARGVALDLDELPEHPDDHFGLRFTGSVEIPEDGEWTFTLTSDDGSRLALDGALLVDNDGLHGTTAVSGTRSLTAGVHSLTLEYWEEGGGEVLELEWSGPGTGPDAIPATALFHSTLRYRAPDPAPVDALLAQRGAAVYRRLRCARCHEPQVRADEALPTLEELAQAGTPGTSGCLAAHEAPAEGPGSDVPRYALTPSDRAGLLELLARPERLAAQLAPTEQLERELARSACFACHRRDGAGGPHPDRADYFQASGDFDLGEEGRIPPPLTAVGAKLFPDVLASVLAGERRVRPYVATRMPTFGARHASALARLFPAADGVLEWEPPALDATPSELQRIGRQLVGTENGLGCIQCHRFQDVPSLGIQAVDLMEVEDRLQSGWFAQLLLDPAAVRMSSRMPSFWEDGRSPVDVLDRDPAQQTAALLAYLREGRAAPLPPGLVTPDAAYELETDDGTRSVSVFMDGVSPRTQLVGSPEGVHVAFDAEHSRLAAIWTGRFFNARGTWEGRAGALEKPMGRAPVELPPGAAVALLTLPGEPWPEVAPERLGQRYDVGGRPVFRYRVGPVTVSDETLPFEDAETGAPGLRRRLVMRSASPAERLVVRLMHDVDDAAFAVRVLPHHGGSADGAERGPVVVERSIDGRRERLTPAFWRSGPDGAEAVVELEYTW